MVLNIILWIIFGALAGWIASMVMSTNENQGGLANIVVGIVGALIGGWLARVLFGLTVSAFSIGGLIIAIIGAIILLAILRAFGVMHRDTGHRV
jgi:uncharacterized membrane protein YeaQ/YmgE (transglycosylase-associated protein family)